METEEIYLQINCGFENIFENSAVPTTFLSTLYNILLYGFGIQIIFSKSNRKLLGVLIDEVPPKTPEGFSYKQTITPYLFKKHFQEAKVGCF